MVDYDILFYAILVAIISINIFVFLIIFLMFGEEMKKETKERSVAEKRITQECPHFFGYLAEHLGNQPIPDECFGCTRAMGCINKKAMENIAEVEEALQQ